jgi:hypothetical protein
VLYGGGKIKLHQKIGERKDAIEEGKVMPTPPAGISKTLIFKAFHERTVESLAGFSTYPCRCWFNALGKTSSKFCTMVKNCKIHLNCF